MRLQQRDFPMRLDSDAAKFFDTFAGAFDTLYDGQRNFAMRWLDRKFRKDMFIRFALTYARFGELKGKTILDIDCGSPGVAPDDAVGEERRGVLREVHSSTGGHPARRQTGRVVRDRAVHEDRRRRSLDVYSSTV